MELTEEEKQIIEAYRKLGEFGRLEVIKQNGKLFELLITNRIRALINTLAPNKT